MPVELEISDGDPWYLSPDIWTVPGNDPVGAPGLPIAGQSCYLWAQVTNRGTLAVTGATVRFYWANPSAGFDRNTANLIGTAFVSLDAGETSDVLCLVPWVPEYVNNGHECVLAEAFHPELDPLPTSPAFDVPTDRHVAQRNLSVIQAAKSGFAMFPFMLVNPVRLKRNFTVTVRQVSLMRLEPLLKTVPELGEVKGEAEAERVALTHYTPGACKEFPRDGKDSMEVGIAGNGRSWLALNVAVCDGPALFHIEQRDGDRVVGGLSVLIRPPAHDDGRAEA